MLGIYNTFRTKERSSIMEINISDITLVPLDDDNREQFIIDNQQAFLYGATVEFGMRDDHFEEDGEIISRKTIENSIDGENAESYRIVCKGETAGGLVLKIDKQLRHGELELLFIRPGLHGKGIGYAAWQAVEELHPEIDIWETVTPYFEKRNIHFYVNRCGFHIVEFYNSHHPDPHEYDDTDRKQDYDSDGMFRFEKVIRR